MSRKVIFEKCVATLLVGLLIWSGLTLRPTQAKTVKTTEAFDLAIITPVRYSDILQTLVLHKENYGVSTKLVTLDEIYNGRYFSVKGRDDAEKIKYFIKDALDSWTLKYVLLMGDVNTIPMRKSYATFTLTSNFSFILTDLYYADVYDENGSFCSWDSNNNSIFGEFHWDVKNNSRVFIDDVDLCPDVGLGRLPVKNSIEVKAVVDKIIAYEARPAEEQWFHRLILMGGDTFPNYNGTEGEIVTEYIASHMPDFTPVKLWMSLHTLTIRNFNKEISRGAGFVSYSGHGAWWGLSTYPVNDSPSYRDFSYYLPYILGLKNGRKLPVMFISGCHTADLDSTLFGLPCFAWALVKKPTGGAIATLGFTEIPYGGYIGDPLTRGGSTRMNTEFFDAYEPGCHVGDMFMRAERNYVQTLWNDCIVLEECELIGDPSLKIGGYSS